jgi:hypothetical protein
MTAKEKLVKLQKEMIEFGIKSSAGQKDEHFRTFYNPFSKSMGRSTWEAHPGCPWHR